MGQVAIRSGRNLSPSNVEAVLGLKRAKEGPLGLANNVQDSVLCIGGPWFLHRFLCLNGARKGKIGEHFLDKSLLLLGTLLRGRS